MKKQITTSGVAQLAVVAIGGYVLWANRFRVQRFLESNGISTPWMTGNAGEALSSGTAKIAGSIEHGMKSLTGANSGKDLSKAI